jgi:hypothetical protein
MNFLCDTVQMGIFLEYKLINLATILTTTAKSVCFKRLRVQVGEPQHPLVSSKFIRGSYER